MSFPLYLYCPNIVLKGSVNWCFPDELIGPLVQGEMFRACLFSTSSRLLSAKWSLTCYLKGIIYVSKTAPGTALSGVAYQATKFLQTN